MAAVMSVARAGTDRLRSLTQAGGGSRRLPWVSLVIVVTLVVCAVFAPLISPHDPTDLNMIDSKLAPFQRPEVSPRHRRFGAGHVEPLDLRRPLRAVHGLSSPDGRHRPWYSALGLVSGYRGGWVDALIMRVTDASLGFPTILVAMILMVILGPGMEIIILAVALGVWDRYARMIRGEVLYLKEMDYVTLARIAGVPPATIVRRHILPNTVNILMVLTSLRVGQVILLEASLSFLGLGLPCGISRLGNNGFRRQGRPAGYVVVVPAARTGHNGGCPVL